MGYRNILSSWVLLLQETINLMAGCYMDYNFVYGQKVRIYIHAETTS